MCLAVTATHPGKVVVLHGLGVFLTPPFTIRDEHTGKILGVVNDVIAGRPPTVVHIGPVGPNTPDIMFQPRAQFVPTLASLQNHFVATPDALLSVDAAPPPTEMLPCVMPIPMAWAPWFLDGPMLPRAALELFVNLSNLLVDAHRPAAAPILSWARARCCHVTGHATLLRNAMFTQVIAHSTATVEWQNLRCNMFGFGAASAVPRVVNTAPVIQNLVSSSSSAPR